MEGADIFVLYPASPTNVTISPRSGTGHVQPQYKPQAQVSLLEGSGIRDGIMTANVRCESCSYSDSSSWIFAYKGGGLLESESMEASISMHDGFGSTTVALSNARSTPENPFLGYDASSPSNQDGAVGRGAGNSADMLIAHGFIMSFAFVLLFPGFALLNALPVRKVVVRIHAPLQVLTLCLAIAGMGLGIKMAKDKDIFDDPHPILGLITVGSLILFQPAMGLLQHLHFRRTGSKSILSILHRWLGRLAIVLGVITGGLGFRLAGIDRNPSTPRSAVIAYSVIAGVMGLMYAAFQVLRVVRESAGGSRGFSGRRKSETSTEAGGNGQGTA